MPWTVVDASVARENALIRATVRYSNGASPATVLVLDYRVATLAGLKTQVAGQLDALNQQDAVLAAPPTPADLMPGAPPAPPAPSQNELLQRDFAADRRKLRALLGAVADGFLPATNPQIAALQASLNDRLTASPALYFPVLL